MPSHQMMYGALAGSGPVPTYTKQYQLLDTLASSHTFLNSNENRDVMVFEGVISAVVGGGVGDYTHRVMYSSGEYNTPLIEASGYTNGIATGLYGETTNPPGYLLIQTYPANNRVYRWNFDDADTEYVTINAAATMDVWSDQEQAMFGTYYNGSNTRLAKFHSFNWALNTQTMDTATYSGAGGTVHEIFQNGGLVNGRVYYSIDATSAGSWGWVDAATGTHTQVVNATQNFGRGLVCAEDYIGTNPFIVIQSGATGEGNIIQAWDTSGSLMGSVALPESTTTYGWVNYITHDRVNNYVWVQKNTTIYVLDMNDYTLVDTYSGSDLPGTVRLIGPVGSGAGGVFAVGIGASHTNLYKLG